MPHVGKRSRSRDRHHRDSRDGREGGREDRGSNQRDRDRHSRGNRDKEHERSSSRQHKRKSVLTTQRRTPRGVTLEKYEIQRIFGDHNLGLFVQNFANFFY